MNYEKWLDDLFLDYFVQRGKNIRKITCSVRAFCLIFSKSPYLELYPGGAKKYRTASIVIDNSVEEDRIMIE